MLTGLRARHFRNLEPLDWRPEPGRHLLLGGNGAGKTSLLEAIYALSTTRSFRTSRLAECCRHGEEAFSAEAEVEDDRRSKLEIAWSANGGLDRRLNGAAGPLGEHLRVLPVVAWTATDTSVLTGAPSARRRFLDRGVLGLFPARLETLSRFRQALAQKRQLLVRRERENGELESWNELLATEAAELITARAAYSECLGDSLKQVIAISGLGFSELRLRYRPSPRDGQEGAETILRALDEARPRERREAAALIGPHRDELELRWRGHALRGTASAGETKVLGLLLAAAQGRVIESGGRRPVYLLDDADAELSRATLERAWGVFEGADQLFASSNRPAIFDGLGSEFRWHVEAGSLRPVSAPGGDV